MTFATWINDLLSGAMPDNIIAYCFNLYETELDTQFDVQLIGTECFDLDNDDWACNAVYSSGENLFSFQAKDWEDALDVFGKELARYLRSDNCFMVLKKSHMAYGFVDGDLQYVD